MSEDDTIQVVLTGKTREWFEMVLSARGWSLFPIPWEAADGTLVLSPPRPDDLPTFGIQFERSVTSR